MTDDETAVDRMLGQRPLYRQTRNDWNESAMKDREKKRIYKPRHKRARNQEVNE